MDNTWLHSLTTPTNLAPLLPTPGTNMPHWYGSFQASLRKFTPCVFVSAHKISATCCYLRQDL